MPGMNANGIRGDMGRNGTDIPRFRGAQQTIHMLAGSKWAGWSAADLDALESIVLEKYFSAFGRGQLPAKEDGSPDTKKAWLRKVVTNAGIDFFRQQQARPADPMDFGDLDDPRLEARLYGAAKDVVPLSAVVANRTDLQRALVALGDAYPNDLKLIRWSVIEDKSLEDVAALIDKSEQTTKKAIQRAVVRLRTFLQPTADVFNHSERPRRVSRRG